MRDLLQTVPIFAGLSPEAFDLLIQEGTDKTYADGEIIFREGEIDEAAYLIERGHISIITNFGQPDERVLTQLQPPEFFGETCLLEMIAHTATACAVGTVTLFCLRGTAFYHLYKRMPGQYGILIFNIARDLSRRLRHLDEVYRARQ